LLGASGNQGPPQRGTCCRPAALDAADLMDNLPNARPTMHACAGDGTAGDDRQLRRSVVVRLHWTFVVGCFSRQLTSSTEASGPPGRHRARSLPPPPRHFEAITQPAAQVSFGTGDLLPKHYGNFPALAQRDKSAYLGKLLEAVPLAPGFAPIEFVSEPSGRSIHRIRIYTSHHEMLNTSRSRRHLQSGIIGSPAIESAWDVR
jgi:hypothetical protein